jgi:uncharacterized protein (DUF1778 family)
MKASENARFDTKLPKSQKELFEYAASIGGFRTLTEFIISSAQEKANEILQKQEQVITTQHDREVFFEAMLNPAEPNEKLKKAAAKHKDLLSKSK